MIKKLYSGGKIKMLEWDMSTITAGDYTVEIKIPNDAYQQWYDGEYRAGGDFENDVPPAVSLKARLIEDIETCLTEEMNQGGKAESKRKKKSEVDQIKIADVVFSFNNHKLINGLQERGRLIATQNFDAMREKEKEI
jgi:hypothetical protein